MQVIRDQILAWVDQDREKIVRFFSDFTRCVTPNPPGDTRIAMEHVKSLLADEA